MSEPAVPSPTPTQLAERIIAVESVLAHLQHDFERLHEVALAVQQELRQLTLHVSRLESRLDEATTEPEVRSADQERPPHY